MSPKSMCFLHASNVMHGTKWTTSNVLQQMAVAVPVEQKLGCAAVLQPKWKQVPSELTEQKNNA